MKQKCLEHSQHSLYMYPAKESNEGPPTANTTQESDAICRDDWLIEDHHPKKMETTLENSIWNHQPLK